MEQESAFVALGVALGVGLLVGFEREQSAGSAEGAARPTMGGVRTYPIVSLAGALATMLSHEFGPWFLAVVFASVAAFVAVSYAAQVRERHDHGVTSEVAFVVTFLLGALAPADGVVTPMRDRVLVLFSAAIVVTLVLSLKPTLHGIAREATKDDVYATLKFLLAAVVLLPLLPDRTVGPLDVVNPFRIGLLIVLIAGASFAGYVAVRVLGPGRGLGLTGLLGGLVSSTAVTLASSRRARDDPALVAPCALSIVLANTVMAPRVAVVVAAVSLDLAAAVALPLAAVTAVGAAASVMAWLRVQGGPVQAGTLKLANPFEMSSAVKLGLLVTALLFAAKFAAVRVGTGGIYAMSAIAGVADVDAVSVSMARLMESGIFTPVAGTAIVIAVAANTVAKTTIAGVVGGRALGRAMLPFTVATIAACAAGAAWLCW